MSYEHIIYEQDGPVAKVWINRESVHNAFNEQVINELISCLSDIDETPETRVLVIGGKGKSFSAGADLNWMKKAGSASLQENQKDAQRLALLFHRLDQMRCTTIARVQGAALGGGFGLAVACDLCIASSEAQFATPEVRIGLAPSTISPYVIRAMGTRQAARYFLTGERIDGTTAAQLGIAHIVTAPDQLDQELTALINHLLKGSKEAIAATKALLTSVNNQAISPELIDFTSQHIAHTRQTDDAKEGLASFLEKRKPTWLAQIPDFKEPSNV